MNVSQLVIFGVHCFEIEVDFVFDDCGAEAYQERNHGGSYCQEQVF